jgi:hypothetical protein
MTARLLEPTPFYSLDKVLETFRRNGVAGILAASSAGITAAPASFTSMASLLTPRL